MSPPVLPAERTETDPDAALIQQAMDAVASRVESLEAEADQLRHRLAEESEIEATRQRASSMPMPTVGRLCDARKCSTSSRAQKPAGRFEGL
ncbi:hypothetical protein [Streptomyces brasiliensis]|uniref:Uncharacterized protein n=1 Tax=Streptomyces brasiliensis TaxID=1954 RepID=A0A917P2J2_9ACTN|nr:hypothetical protein [Streptomyces brasiliensis]GGJ56611.1 hypothetical protein GCM10010121_079100 [Streptomyces brasiliensis]